MVPCARHLLSMHHMEPMECIRRPSFQGWSNHWDTLPDHELRGLYAGPDTPIQPGPPPFDLTRPPLWGERPGPAVSGSDSLPRMELPSVTDAGCYFNVWCFRNGPPKLLSRLLAHGALAEHVAQRHSEGLASYKVHSHLALLLPRLASETEMRRFRGLIQSIFLVGCLLPDGLGPADPSLVVIVASDVASVAIYRAWLGIPREQRPALESPAGPLSVPPSAAPARFFPSAHQLHP